MSKQETRFEEGQRLARERDGANGQIIQMRKALEAYAADPKEAPTVAAESIAQLERSGVW